MITIYNLFFNTYPIIHYINFRIFIIYKNHFNNFLIKFKVKTKLLMKGQRLSLKEFHLSESVLFKLSNFGFSNNL
jgi:hypothetical protein